MSETIKCAECGGTKVINIGENQYRCLYCGATFKVEAPTTSTPQPAQQATPAPQVIIVNQPTSAMREPSPEELREKNRKKEMLNIIVLVIVTIICLVSSLISYNSYGTFFGNIAGTERSSYLFCLGWAIICGCMTIYKYIKYKKKYGRQV